MSCKFFGQIQEKMERHLQQKRNIVLHGGGGVKIQGFMLNVAFLVQQQATI